MEGRSSHPWLGQVVILAAVFGLSFALGTQADEKPRAPVATPAQAPAGPLTVSQVALLTEQEEALFTDDTEYRYLVVRDSLSPRLEELRAAHPEAEILLYKDLSFTADDPQCEFDPFQGAGLSECQARAQESWYLHGADGSRLRSADFPELSAMNIADDGYRKAWLESVLARLEDAGGDGSNVRYDGVWIDDANLYPGHGLDGLPAELSDDEYGAETVEFIEGIAPALEQEGFDAVLNLGMQGADETHRKQAVRLAHSVSMINREQFVRFGDQPELFTSDGDLAPLWDEELTLMEAIQAAGADHHAIVYGGAGDSEAQLYARGTFLLGWNGQDGSALNYRTTDTTDPATEWTRSLGVPVEDRVRVGNGWQREFTGGLVIVNPSADESQEFDLDGEFGEPGGLCADDLELAPTSARMLLPC